MPLAVTSGIRRARRRFRTGRRRFAVEAFALVAFSLVPAALEEAAAELVPANRGVPASNSIARDQTERRFKRFFMEFLPSSVSFPELGSKRTRSCPLQGYRIGQTELKRKLGLSGLGRARPVHNQVSTLRMALSTRSESRFGLRSRWWAGRREAARNPLKYLVLVFCRGPTATSFAADVVPTPLFII